MSGQDFAGRVVVADRTAIGARRGGRRGGGPRSDNGPRSRGGATATLQRPVGPVTLGSGVLTVAELADALQLTPIDDHQGTDERKIMATINQQVDFDTAAKVAEALRDRDRGAGPRGRPAGSDRDREAARRGRDGPRAQ